MEQDVPAKTIGESVDAKCSPCGSRNIQISEEFVGNDQYELRRGKVIEISAADSFGATGRTFGKCRQCGHTWQFRKSPLATI